ncbi:MAG: NTP transferase domain-containing protein [Verrucomicrobiota bacterium]|nr:NTP transferase domain-containing protein [Verrucomicrobiota bacterium]
MITNVTDALILAAGIGSRLTMATGANTPKPLLEIAGRPLISYTIDSLARAGVRRFHFVVGANADSLVPALRGLMPAGLELNAIPNSAWQKANGVSVLCGEGRVKPPFFLTMADHLFEFSLLEKLLAHGEPSVLNLAVDRKIALVFDLDDAMKVQTDGELVTGIGKELETYDAVDTGVFLASESVFDYLRAAQRDGDCSLADGVRLMAADRAVRGVDIGEAWWQDVDTAGMLAQAELEVTRLTSPRPEAVEAGFERQS